MEIDGFMYIWAWTFDYENWTVLLWSKHRTNYEIGRILLWSKHSY